MKAADHSASKAKVDIVTDIGTDIDKGLTLLSDGVAERSNLLVSNI